MSEDGYLVVVTREDGSWLGDVPELEGAHTFARSLPALDRAVREVVVLAAGLPDEAMPGLVLEYEYQTGDPELDATALEVRRLRREADEVAAAATARTSQAAAQLAARGLSVRDIAPLPSGRVAADDVVCRRWLAARGRRPGAFSCSGRAGCRRFDG